MTKQERVENLHMKMKVLSRRRQQRQNAILGGICGALAVCLVVLIGGTGAVGKEAGMYTASAMLFGNAGGYVLTGIIAFMIGVVITVIIRRHLENDPDSEWNVGQRERKVSIMDKINEKEILAVSGGTGESGDVGDAENGTTCPHCGSTNVYSLVDPTRRCVHYRCNNCGFSWDWDIG